MKINGDVTFAFDKIPEGRHIEFTLDFVIDTVTPPTVILDPGVINAPTLPTLTNGLRVVLNFIGVVDDVDTRFIYIGGTISTGGGGGISFPIIPPVSVRGNVSTTQNIDLDSTVAHSTTMTLTGNISITFTNPPATGNQIEWEIEIKQDGTGGHTVTWPAAVVNTPVIDTAAGATTIVVLRTNDGGVVIRTLVGGGSGGGGEVFTWSADHDANGFALVDARFADAADPTKILDLDLAGMTTGITGVLDFNFTTAKTITFSDAVGTVVLSPLQLEFDFNTFNGENIDSLLFMTTAGSLGSLDVGLSSLGSGGFRANVLNNGQFKIEKENVDKVVFDMTTNFAIYKDMGITVEEVASGDVLQFDTTAALATINSTNDIRFIVAAQTLFDLETSGIVMAATKSIVTPQIGFSVLGNLIEDDAGGMIFTTVPGDDFNWDDGTDIFASLDKTLFAINAMSMQYTKIVTPADPGLITLGKVFFNTTTNRINFRRRNDGNTAWINVDLEASGGTPTTISEGDSKVQVIDAGTGRVDVFIDSLVTAKYSFNAVDFSPVVAGGVNLGTASLPWEKLSIKDIEIETGGTLTVTKNNIVSDAGGMILNVPAGDIFTFQLAGNDNIIFDEDEIRFQSGRAHKIVAGPTAIQIISENLTDDIQLFTGASRSNVTVLVEDLKTSFFTDNTETVAYALQIVQNNDTPAVFRTIANIDLIAENSISVDTIYARISASSQNVTSTTERGLLQLGVVSGGTLIAGIDIEGSASSGANDALIGFFGETPVVQQSVASDTLANLYTALRNLGLIV